MQLLSISEVMKKMGYRSRASVYALIEKREFPKPVKINSRVIRWIDSDVDKWIYKQGVNSERT